MSKLEKYPKYKDSGVEWIGEIPEHWEIKPLKYILKFMTGGTPSSHVQNFYDGKEPWVTIADMDGKKIKKTHFISKSAAKFTNIPLTPKGSLLYSFKLSVGQVAFATHNLYTNEAIASFHPDKKTNLSFWYYSLPKFLIKNANTNIYGAYLLNQDLIKNALVLEPPKQEQTKIANYLDQKTAQIDKAISLKEQMIEKLKERRQILINDAVTKGLDPNVKMKDSGVEWIGEIPEGWQVLPGFRVYAENKTKNTGMIVEQVLSLSYGKIVIKPKEKLTGLVPESFETYQIVKPGDIIIRCMDLQNDQTSLRTGIARNDGIITSAYLNLNVIKDFNSEYLHYYLHVLDITKVLYKFGTGLRQNLSYWDFKRLPVLVPSIKEQKNIVEFIELNTQKIDKAISLQQKQIEKLKEYKTALIDSVVTGKILVKGESDAY